MIWLDPLQSSLANNFSPEDTENCERQFAAARRELAAFVEAIRTRFGSVEAAHAAEYWVRLAESEEVPLVDGYPDWRHITVAAASQLATWRFSCPPKDLRLLAQGQVSASGPS
jgi:hypothetical protein